MTRYFTKWGFIKPRLMACFFAGVLLILQPACAGPGGAGNSDSTGGGSTDLAGLEIGEQVSLVPAQEDTSANLVSALKMVRSGSDYEQDQTKTYVYDESMEVFDFINEILCYFAQTHYADRGVVNAGPYQVFVDEGACDRYSDRSHENSNRSSAQNQRDFMLWTVDSKRDDATSPHVVSIWVPEDRQGGEIQGKMTITAETTDTNPFGEFEFYFAADDMQGFIVTKIAREGMLELQTKFEGDDENKTVYGTVSFSYDQTGRVVSHTSTKTDSDSSSKTETEYTTITYNELGYVTSLNEDNETCKDRHVYQSYGREYNLYDSDFTRVDLHSGMPVQFTIDSEEVHGWAGYYGLWFPEGAEVDNGTAVTSDAGANSYSVFSAPGRLIRKTRKTLPLSNLLGASFSYWDQEAGRNLQVELNSGSGDEIRVTQVGVESCDESGCELSDSEPEDLGFEPHERAGLWKNGLGFVNLVADENGQLLGSQEVAYYNEEFVLPDDPLFDDGEVELKCYSGCLEAPLDLSDGNPYLPTFRHSEATTPYYYTISPDDFTLRYNGDEVAIDIGSSELEGSAYQWGVRSSPMVTAETGGNFWEIWQEEESYEWETGPNRHNHTELLRDASGNSVSFDRPLNCTYTHDTLGTYHLEYGGQGQLWGIPSERREGSADFEHWVPLFTVEGEIICEGASYYAKPMVREQMMQETGPEPCRNLSLDEAVGEMTAEFEQPDIGDNPCLNRHCETHE